MITKQQEYISKKNHPYLCNIDMDEIIKHFDEKIFGPFQDKIDRKTFDLKLSKSLCLNDKVIGGYLLDQYSMLNTISDIIYWVEEKVLHNLKFYVTEDFINKYDGKIGILSDFIYIDKKYKGNNYANILIDYGKSLGDYVWGLSVPNESTEYWVNKQDRIKILEYKDDNGLVILTATKL